MAASHLAFPFWLGTKSIEKLLSRMEGLPSLPCVSTMLEWDCPPPADASVSGRLIRKPALPFSFNRRQRQSISTGGCHGVLMQWTSAFSPCLGPRSGLTAVIPEGAESWLPAECTTGSWDNKSISEEESEWHVTQGLSRGKGGGKRRISHSHFR